MRLISMAGGGEGDPKEALLAWELGDASPANPQEFVLQEWLQGEPE